MAKMRGYIGYAVGAAGQNKAEDVVRVQAYLNMVPQGLGGPMPRLKQDGKIGSLTIGAIKRFQTMRFGKCDGTIEPNKQTENALLGMQKAPNVYGNVHVPAAREQALKWLRPAAQHVLAGLDEFGYLTPNGAADQGLLDMLHWQFGAKPPRGNYEDGDSAKASTTLQVRKNFAAAMVLINKEVDMVDIPISDMYGYLALPKMHEAAPIEGGPGGLFINYKFAEWDGVSGYGLGPLTRGALFLQAVFGSVDFVRTQRMTADELYLKLGSSMSAYMPSVGIHDAARYSYFCQAYVAGCRPPAKFYHVPEQDSPWLDVADLP